MDIPTDRSNTVEKTFDLFHRRVTSKTGADETTLADSLNHRIQHLSLDGKVLQVWGTFADVSRGDAPGGTFNEPWGVAVGPDGSVYVSDTWNYRIQKFTADGTFISMWGHGPDVGQEGLYGPRGLAVDAQGRVLVADTGNKRIVMYDGNGQYLSEFGSGGVGTMSQDVFFSFTTLTTTGYGNLVPAGQPGQSLAVMEMIIGQLFLVTALGKIVSVWRPGTWADRKSLGGDSAGPPAAPASSNESEGDRGP
jgi:DNA-binding beta-propeller fold protein YncE